MSTTNALTTPFTSLVGCRIPIQQAAMGGIATAEMAAAVSDAGALGMISGAGTPEKMVEELEGLDAKGKRYVGVNFITDGGIRDEEWPVVEAAAAHCRLVEFFYGDPDAKAVKVVHDGGALACWQIGSVEEAVAAEGAGCDLIVAQGIESGGHVRGTVPLFPLLDAVLDRVKVPVLSAGGVSTARSMAAMLAAGAAGVRVGTRFVCSPESVAHDLYKELIVVSDGLNTTYTEAFSVGWPNAPHRVLQSCIDAAEKVDGDVVGHRADGSPIRKFSSESPKSTSTGHLDAMAMWCGESAGGVNSIMPAGAIVEELASGTARLLSNLVGVVS